MGDAFRNRRQGAGLRVIFTRFEPASRVVFDTMRGCPYDSDSTLAFPVAEWPHSGMRCRLAQWFVVLVLVIVTGGHWTILQSLAWVGMAVSYSQSDSLPVALKKTFDGTHPCNLCKFVAAGKKAEKPQDLQKLETKFDFFCLRQMLTVFPQELDGLLQFDSIYVASRTEAPPGPPPRLA
jgi:hypothetical protein